MTTARRQAENHQYNFAEIIRASPRKTRHYDKVNSRLLLYLKLVNLRSCGGENYKDLSEFREIAKALFTLLKGYTPKDEHWISICTWIP